MNSSYNNISIIDDDTPTPPQSSQQSNERKAHSDFIVISSDEEDGSTIAEKKISDLEFTIKRLKRENREAKKAQDDIEKLVARYVDALEEVWGELEEFREHANRRKIVRGLFHLAVLPSFNCAIQENTKLNDDLTLPDCGHIFCEGCIQEWFGSTLANYRQEHPDFHHNMPIPVPDVV
ncbi:hypothetical protein ARMSODRAFT_982374 [Armillaria solidipes]|uniref:Zinc finger RING-type eukaryotic domain-containing protein n=1 Tax=Armillaria solidipes TaxID=1076256 RepID=A0A2H3B944_9AGAR|nr:hypothetical protein ARMSODRAFT_982374 [Armillaria solidipes]